MHTLSPAKFVLIPTLALAALGWYQLGRYASTPGEQFAAPALWNPHAAHASTPHLIVFIHPGCSCTHATLQQLDKLLQSPHPPVRLTLAVYQSKALITQHQASFDSSSYLHPAHDKLAEFRQLSDWNGALARSLGAVTSGQILLYSAAGQLLFQGGITEERAHLGDNDSADSLLTAINSTARPFPNLHLTSTKAITPHPVFGCSILNPRPPA